MPNPDSFQVPFEFLIVGASVETGLFDEIKIQPGTIKELTDRLEVDYRALWTVTEALTALGYLEYEDNKVNLTPEAYSIFYDETHEKHVGFSFMHSYHLISSWIQLPEVIKSGKPAEKKKSAKKSTDFIRAMSKFAKKSAGQIANYCLKDLPSNPDILDVGGGPLTYAYAFAEKGAKVTVLDIEEVVDMMSKELNTDLPIKMVKGDFTEKLPPGPYDLVYLGNVCHIYGEKENRKLFKDSYNVLKPGGQIVINDMIRGTGTWPAIFGVNMLVNTTTGGTWTYEQYKEWLEDAGFSVHPVQEIAERQLIKADKT